MIARQLMKIGCELVKIVLLYEHLCHEDCNYIGGDCVLAKDCINLCFSMYISGFEDWV